MKNEMIKDMAGIIILYLILVLGVVALNARMEGFKADTNIIVLGE